ncbi:MAG: hypothetical protein JWP38_1912 [Herbaspirillum sp.]|nr:hypothetical protein [Herbaspirillum sp.]
MTDLNDRDIHTPLKVVLGMLVTMLLGFSVLSLVFLVH